MKYHQLQAPNRKVTKRLGRGISSGKGKTAGRGTKGQKSRTGYSAKPGFAGGSNPLMQKLPKLPGFRSHRPKVENVFTGQLEQFASKTVDTQLLADNKLISNAYVTVKVLDKGDLTKKVTVKLTSASESAKAAIESAGGSFESVPRLQRPKTSTKKSAKD
jgi:large subunit ribosomal protein L15